MNTQQKGLHRTRDQLLLTPLIMHHIHVWHDFRILPDQQFN